LCLAWGLSRAWLIAAGTLVLPFYPGGPLAFADLDVYAGWVPLIESGVLPTDDMWQYPPFSAFFFAVGAWGDPRTILLVGIVAVDLLLTLVLYRHAPRSGWAWVGAGVLIGPVLVARFDVVPTLFAVLAVLAAGRPLLVGAWSAVGAALKVWPLLILAIVPRRDALRAGGAFVAATAAMLIVTAITFQNIGGFLGGQGNRGLQVESVGALPFMMAHAFGWDVESTYRYGSMEVSSAGSGAAAVLVTLGLLLAFAWLFGCWWRGVLASHQPADVAFTVVLVSVVFSRVFSPQYSVWLLALGAVCLSASGSLMRGPVALVAAAALCAQVLYPWGYGEFLNGNAAFVAVQALRVALVVAAVVIAVVRVSRPVPTAGEQSARHEATVSVAGGA
jgi:hypothetical protein